MPYSFVVIEKEKTRVIKAVFVFLLVFYFLVAELLWIVTRMFFSSPSSFAGPAQLFSPGEFVIVFAVALAVASLHWYYSTRNMIADVTNLLDARAPDPGDTYHKTFRNVVDEVSIATGGRKIGCYVVPSSGMNAFAVSDLEGNSAIGVTEGLLSRLSRSQLEAVVGHEAAHIASGDSFSTTVICSLFGIYGALLEGINRITLRRSGDSSEERVSVGARFGAYLLVVYLVLLVVKGANHLLNMFISRQREYRADAVAVRLTRDPVALSEALYLISRGWRGVGVIPGSLSPIFITAPDTDSLSESEGIFSDLFSTHPPVKNRLNILLDMAHSDLQSLKRGIRTTPKTVVEEEPVELEGLSVDARKGWPFCPKCGQALSEISYEGAPAMKCRFCGGVLAASDVASRVIARENYLFPGEIREAAEALMKSHWRENPPNFFNVTDKLACPKCREAMERGFFTYGLPVIIDKCFKCGNIWFDKGELEMLQYLIEKSRSGEL
ncbi:MAG: M48 family metalloprotease [Candidatus Omnitrophota bacterium]|jgi:heat shock protein HtpX